jgi:hypothetical protein
MWSGSSEEKSGLTADDADGGGVLTQRREAVKDWFSLRHKIFAPLR